MLISNWLGVLLFAVGVWLFASALQRRSRAQAAWHAAQAAGRAINVRPSQQVAVATLVLRPILYIALLLVAAAVITSSQAIGGPGMSSIDLFGFLSMLLGYAVWFSVGTRYRDIDKAALAPVPVADGPG